MTETGSVASPGSEASMVPMMPAVAAITVLLPPASAWAIDSTSALRLARRSSATMGVRSAITDIIQFPAAKKEAPVLPGASSHDHALGCRSELQRAGMPHFDVPRLGGAHCPDLAKGRLQLVDHQIDDMAGSLRTERAQSPQERLAGQRRVGAERQCARDVGAATDAGIEQHSGPAADSLGNGRHAIDR